MALLLTSSVSAQEYSFQYFGVEQGLTNLAVKTLFQDRVGFIWVGTENGVFRYEGMRFREFSPAQGLPASVRVSIGEAPDGSVLVGNTYGLFRLRGERFEPVPLPAGKHVSNYNGIAFDGQRTWIATDAGLLGAFISQATGHTGELELQPGPQPLDPRNANAQSVFASSKTLWWGCGESLCRSDNGRIRELGESQGLSASPVLAILSDSHGSLWVEQKNRKLLVMHPGTEHFEDPVTSLPQTGLGSPLREDSDGRLLVPTSTGLAIHDSSGFHLAGRPSGVLPPVYSVLQDREGSVWLGLAGRGLAKWLGYRQWEGFSAQSGLTGETVYEILPTPNGGVWAASEAGLFHGSLNNGAWRWKVVPRLGEKSVHAVQAGAHGQLWIGTDVNGLARFDPASGAVKWFGAGEGLTASSAYAVLIDNAHRVWAGTEKGIFKSDSTASVFQRIDAVPAGRCWTIIQAPNGDLWAGTSDGLWQYNGIAWRQFTTRDGLRQKDVISVAADDSGAIWLGYRLSGTVSRLHLTDGKAALSQFDPPAGMPVNLTYFLGFDSRHRLWAGTNLGVGVLSEDGKRWDRYDHRDGLIWDDCDIHGFAAEPDGHVWIGTSGGISRFMPHENPAPLGPPRTVFTSITSGKTILDLSRRLTLNYSSDTLVARFSALRFGRDRDLTFRYRLSPLMPSWRETAERELTFPALQAGNYKLEVEARDAVSSWSDVPATLTFAVKAPWWRTWWFLGACGLSGSLLAGLWFWRRSAREEAVRHALENAVAARTSELSHQYRHDVLTGLPNRLLFGERLNGELVNAKRSGARVAVLFIDLDRFKRINDTWGHQVGDLFLRQISERLLSGLRAGETIARIGGDEFIVLIPDIADKREAEVRGWDLLRNLDAPIQIEGKNVFATMSVGISTFPDDGADAPTLMAAADAAMYRAKGAGKNQVQPFEIGMTEAASRPQNIEDRLRETLKNDGFRLHYQPQYPLDGRLEGFEALLRIAGQESEMSPAEFIPIAEESGLIVDMGAWVFREACRQTRLWHVNGFPDLRIAVNVSVMQLAAPGFEEFVWGVIKETGINPERLELELTETALVKDTGDSAGLLDRFRKRGIQIALDDFGTGYSPMQYLHQLPVDVVKIDQVFIRDLDGSPSSLPLVEGMVKLARTLSLRVVAEGVETPGQFDLLRRIQFDIAQGNLLSRPVPVEQATALLMAGQYLPAA